MVTQAQKELGKLTVPTDDQNPDSADTHPDAEDASEKEGDSDSESGTAPDTPIAESPRGGTGPSAALQSFFGRLQSSVPPNIVSTVQSQLPESLKHPQNIDLSQLRTTLSAEFQRVQGVTRAQAEEYVHKSEHLLREAMKEAGEVLRDAVKVIPPEEGGGSSSQGLVWDGTDMWLLPTVEGGGDARDKGKGKEIESGFSSRRQSEDARRAVATRAQALLTQLKSNAEILKVDPETEASSATFHVWISEVQSKGEQPGTKVWSERVASALSSQQDGQTLQETLDALGTFHHSQFVAKHSYRCFSTFHTF